MYYTLMYYTLMYYTLMYNLYLCSMIKKETAYEITFSVWYTGR